MQLVFQAWRRSKYQANQRISDGLVFSKAGFKCENDAKGQYVATSYSYMLESPKTTRRLHTKYQVFSVPTMLNLTEDSGHAFRLDMVIRVPFGCEKVKGQKTDEK